MSKVLMSNEEIEELAETVITDYIGSDSEWILVYFDIELFISEYLGLNIVEAEFAENDFNKVGFFSDGIRPLKVYQNGKIVSVRYPKNTVVIDPRIKKTTGTGSYRFTLAHEAAHYILDKVSGQKLNASFRTEYDNEKTYKIEELKDFLTAKEWLADKLAAAILMPRYALEELVFDTFKSKRIKIYGNSLFENTDSEKINVLAKKLGVSRQALLIRLRTLKLYENHPANEYLKILNIGGTSNA